ncbi:MAG: hypothetical protein E7057_04295 [Lentisphaerae bacterium]|nr:hypothetical protein [Lentisphaerota bacterium]
MIWGIFAGFSTALINTAGYLFSARFLMYYKNPVRLLVMSSFLMMLISIPFMLWLCPFSMIRSPWMYMGEVVLSGILFLIGQGGFFAALRYFEASRISSLLGLKIIVLSGIFVLCGGKLNLLQMLAVVMATAAAMIFNWSGAQKSSLKGWLMLMIPLICYPCVDMLETDLVVKMETYTNWSKLHSALATVPLMYAVLGMMAAPALFFLKPDRGQLGKALPYAVLWLISQVLLLCCFAFLQPVFGNVILATRGVFSVAAGAALPYFGLAALDSKIPVSLWIRRVVAALVMLGAIALYSFASL